MIARMAAPIMTAGGDLHNPATALDRPPVSGGLLARVWAASASGLLVHAFWALTSSCYACFQRVFG